MAVTRAPVAAEVGHALARPCVQQRGGQRCGGILHPECPGVEARQVLHPRSRRQPHGPGRQQHAAGRRLGARTEGQVERRFVPVRLGDGARVAAPAGPEPGRRIEARAVEALQRRLAPVRDPAQHGIHQAGEGREPPGAGQRDRCRHRGVGRRVQ